MQFAAGRKKFKVPKLKSSPARETIAFIDDKTPNAKVATHPGAMRIFICFFYVGWVDVKWNVGWGQFGLWLRTFH